MTNEVVAEKEEVAVVCDGIACTTGFNTVAEGFDPAYVQFEPGKPTKVARHVADFLVKSDPSRFHVVADESKKAELTPAEKPEAKTGKKKK